MAKRGLRLPKERTFTGPALIWKRILAFLVDILIINWVLFFPFRRIIQRSIPEFSSYKEAYQFLTLNQGYATSLTFAAIFMSLFAMLYFVLLERKIGQTPGKMIFHISILSEAKTLRMWQLLVRTLFLIPVFPFFLLWIIDPLFMFFTKTNQRLSEVLSKTRTVEKYMLG